jgi:hypothetical protein
MKTTAASLSVMSTLILAPLFVVGILKIQQVHAQVDATSSNIIATSSADTPPASDVTTRTPASTDATPPADAIQAAPSSAGLVEVQLLCSQSYTTDLYDPPSGRPDPYVKPATATTTDTVAHVIGKKSYTVCHDARGHLHDFPITADEYAPLSVRGTPQKSVMEPADQATLDSFDNSSLSASDTNL